MNSTEEFLLDSFKENPIGNTDHFTWFITDIGVVALFKEAENYEIYNSNVKKEEIIEQWMKAPPSICNDLPSSPTPHIIVKKSIDPDKDRWAGSTNKNLDPAENLHSGMAIVTTIPEISGNIVKWSAFSENTIRGAAGGCILLAELDSMRRGIIPLSSSGEGYNPL